MNLNVYQSLENNFCVNYPKKQGATYNSPLNFSDDLHISKQRWYRYKEGYSIELVKKLINEYKNSNNGVILDPFLGSGSTIIGSNSLGFAGYGFEVNPFTHFLAKLKLKRCSAEKANLFKTEFSRILSTNLENIKEYPLPNLSFAYKVFDDEIRIFYMKIRTLIESANEEIRDYLILGWISIIESISNYKKSGNGLKIKKSFKNKIFNVKEALQNKYFEMFEDMVLESDNPEIVSNKVINDSSLNLLRYLKPNSIEGVIFSPPYANCFDYTEIYKLELWFGGFVKNKEDIKKLRHTAIRSNLNYKDSKFLHDDLSVEKYISEMDNSLWNKKIPNMLRGYVDDMFTLLDNLKIVLKRGGYCCIVVGNSAYGGVVVPTDLLIAEYAKNNGFIVDKIDVYRYIIPSSQQYEKTKHISQFIRESVVCLKKN